jgi:single-strand DNA-binding protein
MQIDINLVQIVGRIATEPELRVFDSGTRLIRYLITTRQSDPTRRVDVVPVTYWDPSDELVEAMGNRGDRISVTGSIQRRFWQSPDGRQSRLEVVADSVLTAPVEVAV